MLGHIVLTCLGFLSQKTAVIDDLTAADRQVQSAAVAALATSCDRCAGDLVELWESTDRFDVRMHIARAFAMMDDRAAAIEGLIRLSRVRLDDHSTGLSNLLTGALAHHGDASLDALIHDGELGYTRSVYLLRCVLEQMDRCIAPYADRLSSSPSVDARVATIWHLVPHLPADEQTTTLLDAADDPVEAVRKAAAGRIGHWTWSDEQRANNRAVFDSYTAGLFDLLKSDDHDVIVGALRSLRVHDVPADGIAARLRQLIRDPGATSRLRIEAMKSCLTVDDGDRRRRVVEEVCAFIERYPEAVCTALASVHPDRISDDLIGQIVEVMPETCRDGNGPAAELIAPSGYSKQKPGLGARALPALMEAVASDDDRLSSCAAMVLRRLAETAKPAVPMLLEQLERSDTKFRGRTYANALLAIAPHDTDVREALIDFVQSAPRGKLDHQAAGRLLQSLIKSLGDEAWVQNLARPALLSTDHPLHAFAMWNPPPPMGSILEETVPRLRKEVTATTTRDAAWSFALGAGPEPDDLAALHEERDRRIRAARAIQRIEHPTLADADALLAALRSDILGSIKPPQYGEYDPRDRRANMRAVVWDQERTAVTPIAAAVAAIVDRQPGIFPHVVVSLRNHPRALAWVVSSRVSDDSGRNGRLIEVPATLSSDKLDTVLDALLTEAMNPTPWSTRQGDIIEALGRLRCSSRERTDVLMHLIQFGSGEDAPQAAIRALGHTRPLTKIALDTIAGHFDDPRLFVRMAAFQAAGNAGSRALPLIDEIIAIGSCGIETAVGTHAAEAMTQIAADDPRVVEYMRQYRAARDRLHRPLHTDS